LIIRPETLTLDAAAALLDLVPGAMVELRGQDLQFVRAGARGVIALGDPHRGFAAPVALLAVGLYVVYACVRPLWQTAVLLALVVPLVALGNLVRVVVHGLVTMWTHASPTDGSPRDVALVASLVLTYFAMGALAAVLARLFVNADDGLTTATE
jgi:exosortase/archaeosortase family protein